MSADSSHPASAAQADDPASAGMVDWPYGLCQFAYRAASLAWIVLGLDIALRAIEWKARFLLPAAFWLGDAALVAAAAAWVIARYRRQSTRDALAAIVFSLLLLGVSIAIFIPRLAPR